MKELIDLLSYDKETGLFRWVYSRGNRTDLAGKIAGSKAGNGYMQIKHNGKVYAQHRLAYYFCVGDPGIMEIDHINGIKSDNRISNLRLATSTINKQNRHSAKSSNITGALGVSKDSRRGGFTASIRVNGKNKYLGAFKSIEEASSAYLSAKREFHHGCTR